MIFKIVSLGATIAALLVQQSTAADIGLDPTIPPRTLVLDGKRLVAAKAALAVKEPYTTKALNSLLQDADAWLEAGPWSVMDKNGPGPSGDKHDYVSQKPYWWPNEETEDGCPAVHRDGITNPESLQYTDDDGMKRAFESCYALALAWYYTEEAAYAEHASLIIKTWFLNEATKMNPNMQFGGIVPCLDPEDDPHVFGSLIGMSSRIGFVIDAVRILESTGAPGWKTVDTVALKEWTTDMLTWLMESPIGQITLKGFNNHGLYAHLTGITLGLYSGKHDIATELLHNVTYRIDDGITNNGSQPHELIRTQAFHYSMFTLVGFTRIVAMGEKMCGGLDLWAYEGPDGQSIQKAIEFLIPAALGGLDAWPYPEPVRFRPAGANDIIHFAAERGSQAALDALTTCGLPEPSLGDRWYIRPAPQELEASSVVKPGN